MSTERDLARSWQEGKWLGGEWFTSEGQVFQVVYPGHRGPSWGPDFREAVISWQGKKARGDIELHSFSRQWIQHGHDRDLSYNRVILHVVGRDDMPGPTLTRAGKRVPVFSASPIPFLTRPFPLALPCQKVLAKKRPEKLKALLANQGEKWFKAKASSFQKAFVKVEPEEVLYQGLLQALGYGENKVPFFNLAFLLPFRRVQRWAAGLKREERLRYIQALYLSRSGLVPEELKVIRGSGDFEIFKDSLEREEWRFCGIRPANHPLRRLLAGASLVDRYMEEGLIEGLLGSLLSLGKAESYPTEMLMVGPGSSEFINPCWKSSLLGKSRASLMVVNVLLPFAYALGFKGRQVGLKRKALNLFRSHPSLEENLLLRHFRRLLSLPFKLRAGEAQGLLRLGKLFCSRGKCRSCPMAKR